MLLVLLVVLGYFAARFAVDWLARHALVVSGVEYLVLGLLLGPHATGLLGSEQIEGLAPFFTLAIGWMGASVGFRFWIRVLTRTPAMLFRLAFIQAFVTVALARGVSWLILVGMRILPPVEAALCAAVLAAIGVASSLQGARIAAKSLGHRNLAVRQLEVAAGIDALVAIVIISVALAIFHQPVAVLVRNPTPTEWVAIALAVGFVGGWLFHLFLGDERSPDRLFIAVAGAVVRSDVARSSDALPSVDLVDGDAPVGPASRDVVRAPLADAVPGRVEVVAAADGGALRGPPVPGNRS